MIKQSRFCEFPLLKVAFIHLMPTFAAHTGEMQPSHLWQACSSLSVFPLQPPRGLSSSFPQSSSLYTRDPRCPLATPATVCSHSSPLKGPLLPFPCQGWCASAEQMASVPRAPHLHSFAVF